MVGGLLRRRITQHKAMNKNNERNPSGIDIYKSNVSGTVTSEFELSENKTVKSFKVSFQFPGK